MPSNHRQVCAKVNAFVDEGAVETVEALAAFQGIRTHESCQGVPGRRPIQVWFTCGYDGYEYPLMFAEWFGPALMEAVGDSAHFSVYWDTLGGRPRCLLEVRQEGAGRVVDALRNLATKWVPPTESRLRRNSRSACDTHHREPGS